MCDLSREHRNLLYSINTLCDSIESCKSEKTKEKYAEQLYPLIIKFKQVSKKLAYAVMDKKEVNKRWNKKIRSLAVDAMLDLTITEEMRERIISGLEELAERIDTHEDDI